MVGTSIHINDHTMVCQDCGHKGMLVFKTKAKIGIVIEDGEVGVNLYNINKKIQIPRMMVSGNFECPKCSSSNFDTIIRTAYDCSRNNCPGCVRCSGDHDYHTTLDTCARCVKGQTTSWIFGDKVILDDALSRIDEHECQICPTLKKRINTEISFDDVVSKAVELYMIEDVNDGE